MSNRFIQTPEGCAGFDSLRAQFLPEGKKILTGDEFTEIALRASEAMSAELRELISSRSVSLEKALGEYLSPHITAEEFLSMTDLPLEQRKMKEKIIAAFFILYLYGLLEGKERYPLFHLNREDPDYELLKIRSAEDYALLMEWRIHEPTPELLERVNTAKERCVHAQLFGMASAFRDVERAIQHAFREAHQRNAPV
ncbi:MAG: hypothetical protein V4465_00645 [Patescibacteria group bacterium]